jgi:hypothetical protein
MTPADRAVLKAAAEKATPGPWVVSGTLQECSEALKGKSEAWEVYTSHATPAAILDLLAENERLREAGKHMLGWIDNWDCPFKDDPEWKEDEYHARTALENTP